MCRPLPSRLQSPGWGEQIGKVNLAPPPTFGVHFIVQVSRCRGGVDHDDSNDWPKRQQDFSFSWRIEIVSSCQRDPAPQHQRDLDRLPGDRLARCASCFNPQTALRTGTAVGHRCGCFARYQEDNRIDSSPPLR